MRDYALRIGLTSGDYANLDRAAADIASRLTGRGIQIAGPVPLPCLSSHVFGDSEGVRAYRRTILVADEGPDAGSALAEIDVPPSIEIDVKVNADEPVTRSADVATENSGGGDRAPSDAASTAGEEYAVWLPDGLRVKAGDSHFSVPPWLGFYVALGNYLAIRQPGKGQTTAVVVVPDRRFVASFCALGVVLGRLDRCYSEEEVAAEAERLRQMPRGTPVSYLHPREWRMQEGRLCPHPNGVGVRTENQRGGNTTRILNGKSVFLVDSIGTAHRLPVNQAGYQISSDSGFVNAFLQNTRARYFLARSEVHCNLIGSISRTKEEVCETTFCFPTDGDGEERLGTLQDLVGLRRFAGSREKYRAELSTDIGGDAPEFSETEGPHPVTIIDGVRAYLKWHRSVSQGHRIVLLERTHYDFGEAVQEVMADLATRRSTPDLSSFTTVPPGTELLAYTR